MPTMTLAEAAAASLLTTRHLLGLIDDGTLPAARRGDDLVVDVADLTRLGLIDSAAASPPPAAVTIARLNDTQRRITEVEAHLEQLRSQRANQLRALRDEHGMTWPQIAEASGLTRQRIHAILRAT